MHQVSRFFCDCDCDFLTQVENLQRCFWGGPQTLIFFSFLENIKETTKKARISSACRTLKSLGKEGKTLKIARNSLQRKKSRQSKKARKRRSGKVSFPLEKPCDFSLARKITSECNSFSDFRGQKRSHCGWLATGTFVL